MYHVSLLICIKYDIATHVMIDTQGLEECCFLCAEYNNLKKILSLVFVVLHCLEHYF